MASDISKRIKQVIDLELAPFLKLKGFKRKGNKFIRIHDAYADVLKIQSGMFNRGEDGYFFVRFGLDIPAVTALTTIFPTTEKYKYGRLLCEEDIDQLEKRRFDWEINPNTDIDKKAKALLSAVQEWVLPWFDTVSDFKVYEQFLTERIRYYQQSVAIAFLNGHYANVGMLSKRFYETIPLKIDYIAKCLELAGIDIEDERYDLGWLKELLSAP